MAAEVTSWSLFDRHCFCESDGSCMRRLFTDESHNEIPIGHQECIRTPSPPYQQQDNRHNSPISVSSKSGSSTLIDNSPGPGKLMTSHSITMTEATTALEKSNAVEIEMQGHRLRIPDTVTNASHIEYTTTFSDYNEQKRVIRLQDFQKCDMTGYETMFDEPKSNVMFRWSICKLIAEFGRLLRYLCGLSRSTKSVGLEQV